MYVCTVRAPMKIPKCSFILCITKVIITGLSEGAHNDAIKYSEPNKSSLTRFQIFKSSTNLVMSTRTAHQSQNSREGSISNKYTQINQSLQSCNFL